MRSPAPGTAREVLPVHLRRLLLSRKGPGSPVLPRRGRMTKKVPVQFTLNGEEQAEFVESGATLLDALRDKLGDMRAKGGCGQGTCGACTVIDRRRAAALLPVPGADVRGRGRSRPLEGLAEGGVLHPLQRAFVDGFAAQCGFCTPGMIMAAKALLDRNPDPSRDDVVEAISGNICRCTGYEPIINAVLVGRGANARQRERLRSRADGTTSRNYFADERTDDLQAVGQRAQRVRHRPATSPAGRSTTPTATSRACCT